MDERDVRAEPVGVSGARLRDLEKGRPYHHACAGAAPARQVPQGEGRMMEAVDFVRRNFIASIPLISDLQRSFYGHYIRERYGVLFI